MKEHIYKYAGAQEYISCYDMFSLHYDELELIKDDLSSFITDLKAIYDNNPELSLNGLYKELKIMDEQERLSRFKRPNNYDYEKETELWEKLKKAQKASSLESKIKFLTKKLMQIGHQWDFIDDTLKISVIEASVMPIRSTSKKDISKTLWFQVGLKFADGTIKGLHEKGDSATKIAQSLGNKNFRPYISTTIGNTVMDNKNIYSSANKIELIKKYCQSNSIKLCPDFVKKTSNYKEY